MWGLLGFELELNLGAERERGRKGGGNLRDEGEDKTSSGPAQAEGSCPRIHTSQHRSMAPTAAGGGEAVGWGHGSTRRYFRCQKRRWWSGGGGPTGDPHE